MSLAGYEFQLQQIKASLALDPENEKLKALASKIQDLINLNTKALEESSLPVKTIDFFVGETCEVKEETDGHWQAALIQSISSDKFSCTVIFPDGRAQHCTKSQVRRPFVQRKDSESAKISEKFVVFEKDASKINVKPSKRKHTRQEHEQKKEAEQKEKQVQWQTFSSKISKNKTFKEIKPSFKNRLKDSE